MIIYYTYTIIEILSGPHLNFDEKRNVNHLYEMCYTKEKTGNRYIKKELNLIWERNPNSM